MAGKTTKLRWMVSRWSRIVGYRFFWGMAISLGVISFYENVVHPMEEHIAAKNMTTVGAQTGRESKFLVSSKDVPSAQLARFYNFFPGQDAGLDLIAALFAAASKQDLVLEQGTYQLQTSAGNEQINRYVIVLPVKGGYVPIRRFVAQALTEIPTLALDRITFSRKGSSDAVLDAELSFTLYLGKQ